MPSFRIWQRLLAPVLDQLSDAELLLVGHRFEGVSALLEKTRASVIDLATYHVEAQAARLVRELMFE